MQGWKREGRVAGLHISADMFLLVVASMQLTVPFEVPPPHGAEQGPPWKTHMNCEVMIIQGPPITVGGAKAQTPLLKVEFEVAMPLQLVAA